MNVYISLPLMMTIQMVIQMTQVKISQMGILEILIVVVETEAMVPLSLY